MKKTFYTTFEISQFCEVSMLAVIKWIDQGKLLAHKTPGGHRRVNHKDLLAFLHHFEMPIPVSLQELDRKRVLIVDDEEIFVRVAKRMLEKLKLDLDIEIARDGYEAGEKVSQWLPDLVLLDLQLPGTDGLKVCRKIKNNHS